MSFGYTLLVNVFLNFTDTASVCIKCRKVLDPNNAHTHQSPECSKKQKFFHEKCAIHNTSLVFGSLCILCNVNVQVKTIHSNAVINVDIPKHT